jgi:hypothetical protein
MRAQISTQINKNSSLNEAKKLLTKTTMNLNSVSSIKTTKSFYKTMIKPGGISSQSFVQVPDCLTKPASSGKQVQSRFSSQTPRNIVSPEHSKLQKTAEIKTEFAQHSSRVVAVVHHTP